MRYYTPHRKVMFLVRSYWGLVTLRVAATVIASGVDAGLLTLLRPLINHGFSAGEMAFLVGYLLLLSSIFLCALSCFASVIVWLR